MEKEKQDFEKEIIKRTNYKILKGFVSNIDLLENMDVTKDCKKESLQRISDMLLETCFNDDIDVFVLTEDIYSTREDNYENMELKDLVILDCTKTPIEDFKPYIKDIK